MKIEPDSFYNLTKSKFPNFFLYLPISFFSEPKLDFDTEKLERSISSLNLKLNDITRELSILKDCFTTSLRKTQEDISEELLLGFSSMQALQSSTHQSPNNPEEKFGLPKQFAWKEPFYALGKNYYFLKSRLATEMVQFLNQRYPEFESAVVLKYFCGLRNEWKKRISEGKRMNHEFSEEDYAKVLTHWKSTFGTLNLVALEGGDVNLLFLLYHHLTLNFFRTQ